MANAFIRSATVLGLFALGTPVLAYPVEPGLTDLRESRVALPSETAFPAVAGACTPDLSLSVLALLGLPDDFRKPESVTPQLASACQ